MSIMSKSPLEFWVAAWAVTKRALPANRQVSSPKKFMQHQLFACLVLKNFQRLDYCDIVEQLLDCPSLLDETVAMQMGRLGDANGCRMQRLIRQGSKQLVPEPTSCDDDPPSGNPVEEARLSVISQDVRTHFILAYRVGKGPRPNVNEFRERIDQASKRVRLHPILAEAGYDSEPDHRIAGDKLHLRTISRGSHDHHDVETNLQPPPPTRQPGRPDPGRLRVAVGTFRSGYALTSAAHCDSIYPIRTLITAGQVF